MKKQKDQSKTKNISQIQQFNKKNVDQNKLNNPNKNQKQDLCNFERLYSEIVEVQSDIETQLKGTQDFFNSYMNSIICPDDITKILKLIEYNSSYQEKLAENFKKHLLDDLAQNSSKAKKSTKITKQIDTKTYQVARAKDMYRELNQMCHADIISHKKEIQKINDLTKVIHDEITGYEKEIERLNIDNKNTYSEELNLLDTVMNFDKKLYTIYVTREEKKKEKANIQSEIQKILEEKKTKEAYYKEQLDIITNKKNEIQENFEKEKEKIENLISNHPLEIEKYNNIFNKLKEFYTKKSIELKNIKEDTEMLESTYKTQNANNLKNYLNDCDSNTVKKLFDTVQNIQNTFPFLQIPNNININNDSNMNIIDISESLNKQMLSLLSDEKPQEKLNREKENKILELELKIGDKYRNKFIKKLFFSSLKINVTEEKRRKEAEKKLQELKNKEEQLKLLQMKYINEQENKKNEERINSEKRTAKNEKESQNSFEKEDKKEDKKFFLNKSDRKNVLDKKEDRQFLLDKSEKKYKVDKNEDWREEKEKYLFDRKREDKKEDREKYLERKNDKKEDLREEKEKYLFDKKREDKKEDREKYIQRKNEKKEDWREERMEERRDDYERRKERSLYKKKDKRLSINKKHNKYKKRKNNKNEKKINESDDNSNNLNDDNDESQYFSQKVNNHENNDEQDLYNLVNEFEMSQKKKQEQKQKQSFLLQSEKNNNNKKSGNFMDSFGQLNESTESESINPFDLNDLNFLTELGETLNKSEKNYGFGRKNFRK